MEDKQKNLTPGNFEVQFVSIDQAKKTLLFSANKNDIDRQHIWRVNPSIGSLTNVISGNGIQWSPVATVNNQLFCMASSGTKPAHVAKIEGNQLKQIMDSDFPDNQLVEPEQVVFSAADGIPIHGQLFKPKKIEEGKKISCNSIFSWRFKKANAIRLSSSRLLS